MYRKKEIEFVKSCVYCNSTNLIDKYENVKDWFDLSCNNWKFLECQKCKSLLLNPRPKEQFIHRSYQNYYTNFNTNNNFLKKFKRRLQNSYISSKLNKNIYPSLYPFNFLTNYFHSLFMEKFELDIIKNLNNYNLTIIDFGCGDGMLVKMLNQIGYNAYGIDFNNKVKDKKNSNYNERIIIGNIETLDNFPNVDIIICSHVLEHVYNPKKLIRKFYSKLNVGGRLILSTPNAESHVLKNLKHQWRGLEAPRHISIPTKLVLENYLKKTSFKKIIFHDCFFMTDSENNNTHFWIKIFKRFLKQFKKRPNIKSKFSDFIQIEAYK